VLFFTILSGILVFWLLGFIVDDIGQFKGPQLADVEARVLDQALVRQADEIGREIAAASTRIENQKARQALLRDSTTSSQQTMNQLLDMQKQNIQNNIKPSVEEQNVLAQSQALFIANQSQYQALNEEIVKLTEDQRGLEERRRVVEEELEEQREKAVREFEALDRRHRLRVAAVQLLLLLPLLLAAVYAVLKWRKTIYASLIYAFGVAILVKVILVIHENFPTRYFKYVLLLFSLGVVIRIVVYLIRAAASPKIESLLKQYREAYERFLCPICEYPIRRGPLRYRFWNRRTIRKLVASDHFPQTPEEPYTCPSCGSGLFEPCSSCQGIRHSLLRFCEHCGEEKALDPVA
jgi:hypothetical protein